MAQQDLSKALDGFASVLTELELEPIRLDLIRIENEIKSEVAEKFDILKDAIENLATKVSDAFAEELSAMEANHIEVCEKLSERISALEAKQ